MLFSLPFSLLLRPTSRHRLILVFNDTVYLNDKDEQLFITAMKKFGFNKQITGRNKKVFSDAIQEKKGTLHNSHLHSGFNEAVVKIVTLSILILLLISCKQKVLSQPCQNLISKSSNNVFLLGDSIIANSAFSNQVNTSCATGKEGCILEKLTIDYYSSLSKESGSVLILDKYGRTYKSLCPAFCKQLGF